MFVDEIYDALTDDEVLGALPSRLRSVVPARSASFFTVEPSGAVGLHVHCGYFDQEAVDFFRNSDIEDQDPFLAPVLERGLQNRAFSSASLMHPDELDRTPYINELYRARGDDTLYFLAAMVTFRGGYGAVSLQRGRHEDPYTDAEVAALQPLLPHFARMLGLRALSGAVHPSAMDAFEAGTRAVLVADRFGRVCAANARGERLWQAGGPLLVRNGRLHARVRAADDRLQLLMWAAGTGARDHGGAMLLPSGEAGHLRVVIAPWRSAGRTRVLIVVDDPNEVAPSTAARLAGLYGLTAAEAQTVLALVEGLSPAEAAEARGVSLATVRTQIHQALRKSEARTISDLVRLAASLPRFQPSAP